MTVNDVMKKKQAIDDFAKAFQALNHAGVIFKGMDPDAGLLEYVDMETEVRLGEISWFRFPTGQTFMESAIDSDIFGSDGEIEITKL